MFQRLKALAKEVFSRTTTHYRAEATEDGVTMFENDEEVYRFRWNEVVKIEAYRRDIRTSDLICLSFYTEDSELYYSPHAEVDGFEAICEYMARHFPAIDPAWREDTALPFEPKSKVLFQRGGY